MTEDYDVLTEKTFALNWCLSFQLSITLTSWTTKSLTVMNSKQI
jgi:hypothetical protein